VKLIILKGAGGKAFCCGGDIRGNGYIILTELVNYSSVMTSEVTSNVNFDQLKIFGSDTNASAIEAFSLSVGT